MKKPTDTEVLERLEKWFPGAQSYWDPHHKRFRDSKRFGKATSGDNGQWTPEEINSRSSEVVPRITLTENLLGPFANQVINDIKQSDFGAKIKPKDNGTDVRLAKVRQGLHRGIQQIGGWKEAFGQTADDLIFGGLGAFRFVTQRRDPSTMRKEIRYMHVDPTRMFHGNGSNRKSNFSDVMDSAVYEPYSKEKFKEEFGRDPEQFMGRSDTNACWGKGDTPWVMDYWFVEKIPDTIVMYQGKEYLASDPKLISIAEQMGMKPVGLADLDAEMKPITEATHRCQVWNAKLVHREVLRLDAWPGYFIPNFLVTGRKVDDDKGLRYFGLLEPAFDVQRAHNFAFSALVERAGMAPKVRIFLPIEGMDPKFKKIYDNIASWNGVVPYKSLAKDGTTHLDKPYQEPPIQTDPAFADLRAMTTQGIRDVLGMWESSLGGRSAEKSGIAIQTRERQSDTGNFDWGDNLSMTAEHCFQAVDEILNKIIDVPTQVRIVGEDDSEAVIWAASLDEGMQDDRYYDLNRGKYDILCKMSPSTDTKREEELRGLQTLIQGNPELATVLGPEYVAAQDWRGAEKTAEIMKRFRTLKYPGIDGEDEKQNPQIQQMQQQLQQFQGQLEQLAKENEALKSDKAIEEKKLGIEGFKAQSERIKVISEAKAKDQELEKARIEAQKDVAVAQVTAQSGGNPGVPAQPGFQPTGR